MVNLLKRCFFNFIAALLVGLIAASFAHAQSSESEPETPKIEVWGYVFGDFFWKAQGDTATWGRGEYMGTEKGMMGGSLRRLYVGFDGNLGSGFSTRVLLEANQGTPMPNGAHGTIVKLGYLQWKAPDYIFYNQQLSVGLIPTPIFTFPQRTWGYRSVEKEALDSRGIGRSVDQGFSYSASFDPGAKYGFTLMAANGSGTRPVGDKYLEYTASVYARLFDKRLTLETMANYKYQGDGLNSNIIRGFAAYELERFRFGFEVSTINENLLTSEGYVARNPFLYSAFYAFKMNVLKQEMEFFMRYDKYNPDLNFNDDKIYPNDLRFVYDQSLFIFGVNYNPIPAISIIPNIYINVYDDKRDVDANRESDVVLRFTLYYRF